MSKIAILTDSSCDIPQEMAEKYGIDIMSFHILLDDVDYVERCLLYTSQFQLHGQLTGAFGGQQRGGGQRSVVQRHGLLGAALYL